MGFISQFILPKEVDFDSALQKQAHATHRIVEDLQKACLDKNIHRLEIISKHAEQARALKSKNMKELLDVFITPYDKESIYRIITQLDWVALSIKHFKLEISAYGIQSVEKYQAIMQLLVNMSSLLEKGIKHLSTKNLQVVTDDIELIHDHYDSVVELCARAVADLLIEEDCKHIIMHKDVLTQLKEVAKRIHVTANTLEDMAIKII